MPNTHNSLLPPNANETEKKLEQALVFDGPLRPLVQSLHQLRTNKPDTLAPWLTGEWGIGSFAKHFANTTDFYNEALEHLQRRGTAQAVRQALAWLNADVAEIEVENFYLHIHLASEFRGNLADFKHAVEYSIPIHLDFYRVTAGDDGRHGVYDTRNYDDAVYDSDAGVLIDDVLIDYAETVIDGTDIIIDSAHAHTADTMLKTKLRTWQHVSGWINEPWATSVSMKQTTETV